MKHFTQNVRWLIVSLLLCITAIGNAKEVTDTYVFTSNNWNATLNDEAANWTSGQNGNQFTTNQGVQITTGASGANATSPISFTNISKIVVTYCTNASNGVGSIAVKVGNGTAKSFSVTKPSSGGTTLKTAEFIYPKETGFVNISVTCTTNSIYIYSIAITYEDNLADHELSYSNTTATALLGEPFDAPVLNNPHDLSVTYTSSNATVAQINENGELTIENAGTTTITASFDGNDAYKAGSASYLLIVKDPEANEIADVLTKESMGLSGSSNSYNEYSNIAISSNARYYAYTAFNSSGNIQLNNNNKGYGIVSTVSGGKVKSITIKWDTANTSAERTIDIYGKNTAYSTAQDLYGATTKGVQLGSLVYKTDAEEETLIVDGDYEYVGLLSNKNALYIKEITIVWALEKDVINDDPKTGALEATEDGESVYYMTYVTTFDVDMSQSKNVDAYIVTGVEKNGSTLAVQKVNAVPTGTALLLKATVNEKYTIYEAPYVAEENVDLTANLLKAGNGEKVGTDVTDAYGLGEVDGKTGFYRIKEGVTIPTNKAYLLLSDLGISETKAFYGLYDDSEATGIKLTERESADAVYYNLQGQRVVAPTHGIYIVNGKKVFIK